MTKYKLVRLSSTGLEHCDQLICSENEEREERASGTSCRSSQETAGTRIHALLQVIS